MTKKSILFLAIIVVILFQFSQGQTPIVFQDRLIIDQNLGQIKKGTEFKVYPANAGFVPYGQKIRGKLVKADPEDGCDQKFPEIGNPSSNEKIFILAKRGNCKFAVKAYNAQLSGAYGIIIADNQNTDWEDAEIMEIQEDQFSITIMVIDTKSGDLIYEAFEEDDLTEIYGVLQFELQEKYKTIDYEYFFSSLQVSSYDFIQNLLNNFDTFHNEKGLNIIFELYSFLMRGGPNEYKVNENCIQGDYCALDPDFIEGPLTGADQIEFDLKILCIQEQFSSDQQGYKQFLRYLVDFREFCLMKIQNQYTKAKSINECFFTLYQNLKYKYNFKDSPELFKSKIDSCVEDSKKNPKKIPILEQSLDRINDYNVHFSPELFINQKRIHGNLGNSEELNNILCNFAQNPPGECSVYMINQEKVESSNLGTVITISILIVISLVLIGLFFYRRHLKKQLRTEMNDTVQSVVSSYMAMQDSKI